MECCQVDDRGFIYGGTTANGCADLLEICLENMYTLHYCEKVS